MSMACESCCNRNDFTGRSRQWGGLQVGTGGIYYASGGYLTGVLERVRTGGRTLFLPTKNLLGIESIIEDGTVLLPPSADYSGDFQWSQSGVVTKSNGSLWTANYASNSQGAQGLSVKFTHGYSAAQAEDWRKIVLAIADRSSMVRGLIGGFSTNMGPYRVNSYFGESRTGTMPKDASWLDDLMALIDTKRYVRVDDW